MLGWRSSISNIYLGSVNSDSSISVFCYMSDSLPMGKFDINSKNLIPRPNKASSPSPLRASPRRGAPYLASHTSSHLLSIACGAKIECSFPNGTRPVEGCDGVEVFLRMFSDGADKRRDQDPDENGNWLLSTWPSLLHTLPSVIPVNTCPKHPFWRTILQNFHRRRPVETSRQK